MQISEAQNAAAGEFVDLIAGRVSSGGRAIHPETAIAGSARMAGSLLLRSFHLGVESEEPGVVLLSNEANEKGPMLFGILAGYLAQSGVLLNRALLGGEATSRGAAPHLSVLESLALLQDDAIRIAKYNNLSLEEAAQAAALATGFIVKECAGNIGAETGFNVAMFSFIEGSKTVPPPLGGATASAGGKKPWCKTW